MTPRGPGALCHGPGVRARTGRAGLFALRHQPGLNRIPRFGHPQGGRNCRARCGRCECGDATLMVRMAGDRRRRHRRHTRPVVVPGDDARRRTGARLYAASGRVLVRIRADMTNRGRVSRTKDISSARSHAGAVFGVLPAPAEIVAGGRSTDVRSVLRNGAVIDSSRRSHHPLPWRNTPSGGENHVSDAAGRPVYDGAAAAEMFRLYTDAVQAESELTARRVADHPRRRGRRSLWAWPARLASRVGGLLHRR